VTDAGQTVVEFREVELEEVSITPRPAVPGANVSGVRSESDRDAATHLHTIALRALFERAGPERFAALVRSVAGDEPAAPKFGKGARVEALADHMEGMKGSTGKVTLVRNGPYYGVTFDGERKVHKWLAEDEIKTAADEHGGGDSAGVMPHGKARARSHASATASHTDEATDTRDAGTTPDSATPAAPETPASDPEPATMAERLAALRATYRS
jgi:hypothetical protein